MMDAAMFDIAKLDVRSHAEEGAEVRIINPRDGSDTGIVVKVLGVFAPRFKELLRQAKKRDEMRRKSIVASAVAGSEEEEIAELLAEVTLGWSNMCEAGKPLTFSKSEAVRVYTKYALIRQQVFDAALDVANFVKD